MKNKKLLFSLAAGVLMGVTSVHGQAFEQGKSVVSAGYGIGNFTQALFQSFEDNGTYTNYKYTGQGPFFLKYEYAVSEKVGFGVNVAYIGAKASYEDPSVQVSGGGNYKETITFKSVSFLPRVNFHFGDNDKFDPYFGVGLGYRTASWKYDDNDPDYDNSTKAKNLNPFGMDMTLGARYFFTDNIGIYGETGIAKGIIQFGLSAKF